MEELNQMVDFFTDIEKKDLQHSDDVIQWVKDVSSPEFGLIESCSELLVDQISNITITDKILKILRKIYYYEKEQILVQMLSSSNYTNAIIKYISKTPSEKISKEAIFLLDQLFFDYNYPLLFFEETFVKSLFNTMEFINTEETMYSIIKILSIMNFIQIVNVQEPFKSESFVIKDNYDKLNDAFYIIVKSKLFNINDIFENTYDYNVSLSIIVDYFNANNKKNSNCFLFLENLIRVANAINCTRELSLFILLLIYCLMISSQSSLLYTSDLESFIDYIMKRLESTDCDLVRNYLLKVLFCIIKYPGYIKSSNYKRNVITEVMESYIESDLIDDELKEICVLIQLLLP